MAARDIRAGGAFVEFTLRKNALTRGLRAVSSELNRFGKQATAVGARLAGLGAAITAPFAIALRTFIKVGDGLDKMAARTGVSVEALSSLGFAAEQTGANAETLEKGVRGMQRAINDLGRGLSTQKDAFGELGISFEQIENLSPEDQFKLIADRIAQIENPSKRAALSMQVFGRAGSQLLPLLSQGSQGIEAFQREAERLGIVIDTDTASAAARLGDLFNILKKQLVAAAVAVGSTLEPTLSRISQLMSVLGSSVITFVKTNRGLIVTVAAVGVGLVALGGALIGLGVASIGAAAALSVVAGAVGLILSPLGLIVGVAGAAAVAIFKFTDLGGQAASFLKDRFGGLGKFITETFGAIGDAIAGGDIRLAAEILWTSLRLVFLQGGQGIIEQLIKLKSGALTIWAEIKSAILTTGNSLYGGLQTVWANIAAGAKSAFSKVGGDANSAFNLIQLGAAKSANAVKGALNEGFDVTAANRQAEEDFAARQRGIENKDRSAQTAARQKLQADLSKIEEDRANLAAGIQANLVSELEGVARTQEKQTNGLTDTIKELERKRAELLANIRELPALGDNGSRFNPSSAEFEGGLDTAEVRREITRGVTNSGALRGLSATNGNKTLENIFGTAKESLKVMRETNRLLNEGNVVSP